MLTPYKVLVIGGSYGGLAATLNLLDLCHGRPCRFSGETELAEQKEKIPVQITIVDERDGYCMPTLLLLLSRAMLMSSVVHLIGTPLAFADTDYASKSWVKYTDIPALQAPEIRIIRGTAAEVDAGKKTCVIRRADTKECVEESYDYLVAASGLRRTWPSAPRSLTREEFLVEAGRQVEHAKDAREGVVVIGGGSSLSPAT